MSLFFKEGSQATNYQDTAFFQSGEASKVSIFDNPPQSETQLAYNLFNIDSVQPQDSRDRSIISKIEIFERNKEDFMQTPLPNDHRQQSKRDVYLESQESKDSRMTFGAKIQTKMKGSKVEEPKFYEEKKEASKPKGLAGVRARPNEPSSNFSLFKQANPVKQPESMPVKFDQYKPQNTAKPAFDPSNSSSSSFSIDFEEIRQRNQIEVKPIAKQVTSLKLNNEKEIKDGKSQSGRSERISENYQQQSKFDGRQFQKQKKLGFNFRRSKVQQNKDKPQGGFLLKANSPNTSSNFNLSFTPNSTAASNPQVKIDNNSMQNQEKTIICEQTNVTPFKIKPKDIMKDLMPEKILISSNVKRVETERRNIFNRNPPQEQKIVLDNEKSQKVKVSEQNNRKTVELFPKQQKKQEETSTQKEFSVKSDSNEGISKDKRQSIGLKEQLKKLTSRPTEKIELKSIAFNKGFKLKPRPAEEKQTVKTEESNPAKQNGVPAFTIQKPIQNQQKISSKPYIGLKEEKSEFIAQRPTKSSDFSKYMLILMELQQECETLKGKTVRSRNSYRELAILNDDINRRIDELLKETSKK